MAAVETFAWGALAGALLMACVVVITQVVVVARNRSGAEQEVRAGERTS